ncbi:MAG: magnesium transporter [Corallococcus sp.]|nr:magnesium transporter [Corallococcus sp.]MCM1359292.1 magnesium transporter [Corallococcus sp.]MCM1394684.1 magnesium transporter [Corallococcus sp.]
MEKEFDVVTEEQEITIQLLQSLLNVKDFRKIKRLLENLKPQDTAALLEELPEKEMPPVFRLLSKENAAETFVEMSSDKQELLLSVFSDAELKAVFEEMFLDDTVDIIEEMPANVVKRIIAQSDTETRKQINEILQYPKDSAGTIMTVEYVSLKEHWTVMQCFEHIRKIALDKETIYNCYVTDDKRKLLGSVTVKDLLLNKYETTVTEIMEQDVICVETTDDKEFAAQQISKYDLSAIPVTDAENRIVGIITVDDVLDVMEQEATEDIAKMAAVTPSNDTYMEQSVWQIWKNRLPWLLILMLSATFTGLIINHFENTLDALLFACVPMIMGTGGNAGSQASVTITRSLAIDEIRPKDTLRVLWKELRVAACLAAVLAIACFGKLYLIDGLLFHNAYTWDVCLTVSIAMFLTIMLAKFVGCLMPILAKVCRLDPAVVASPFITTIVDIFSLLIFCGIATTILPAI